MMHGGNLKLIYGSILQGIDRRTESVSYCMQNDAMAHTAVFLMTTI